MASATNKDDKAMATDLAAFSEEPDHGREPSRPSRPGPGGFFTIYKQGQGYWTRIFTAIGAALLIALTAEFIYTRIPAYFPATSQYRGIFLAGVTATVVAAMMLVWWLMNKPSNADFLIATDSEMKKVNWTSRHELIGSTKVVILFMFMIAALLFVLDLYFTRMFYLVGVLATDAPLWKWVGNYFGPQRGPWAKAVMDIVSSVIVIGGTAWAVTSASKSR